MSRKLEIELEKKICAKVVDDLLKAGYAVGVNDGEETVIKNSTDKGAIMAAVFSTDEDYILAYKNKQEVGWVRLIWGNVKDLISDYSMNLENVIKPALELSEAYND